MDHFLIILFSLWAYPILSLILLYFTKQHPTLRKGIFYSSFTLATLTLVSLLTTISTTSSDVDWMMFTSIYWFISLALWWLLFHPNTYIKIIGTIAMVLIFGLGYFSSTVGLLGIGFVAAEFETDKEERISENLIYKESSMGNTISEYRGKRIEIYKTLKWLPFIEWQSQEKVYSNYFLISANAFTVDYQETENKLYLSASKKIQPDSLITWADTITVK